MAVGAETNGPVDPLRADERRIRRDDVGSRCVASWRFAKKTCANHDFAVDWHDAVSHTYDTVSCAGFDLEEAENETTTTG